MGLPQELKRDLEWDYAYPLSGITTRPIDTTAPTVPVFEGTVTRGRISIRGVGFQQRDDDGRISTVFDPKWCFSGRTWNRLTSMRNTRQNREKLKREILRMVSFEARFEPQIAEGFKDLGDTNMTMSELQHVRMEIAIMRTLRSHDQRMEHERRDAERRGCEGNPATTVPIRISRDGLVTIVPLWDNTHDDDTEPLFHEVKPRPTNDIVLLRETDGERDFGPTCAVLRSQVHVSSALGPPLAACISLGLEDVFADCVGDLVQALSPPSDEEDDGYIRTTVPIDDEVTGQTTLRDVQVPVRRIVGRLLLFDFSDDLDPDDGPDDDADMEASAE